MALYLASNNNNPLKLINHKPELIDFLVKQLHESLLEVFTFQKTLDDVAAMVTSLRCEDQYKPRYEANFVLFDAMCAEEPELGRCGKDLLQFYKLIHEVADHHGRALTTAEIVRTALIALGAEETVFFALIIDEMGAPANLVSIASEPAFEKKYGVRVRVYAKHEPENTRPAKGKRGLRGSRK